LFTTAKSCTPSEFDFDAFTRKEVLAVSKHADDKGYSYHKIGGYASIGYDRVKPTSCDLGDSEGWVDVLGIVSSHHRQGKKGIYVKVVMDYARRAKKAKREDFEAEDIVESSGQEEAPVKKRV